MTLLRIKDKVGSRTYLGLLTAVLAVSWAAILVRWCGDAPALIIAFYRMFWATGIFAALYFRRPAQKRQLNLSRKSKWLILFSGMMLALHFAAWIGSLKFTSVAHALTLGATGPIFALLLAPFLLKEHIDRRAIVAVVLAFAGIVVIAGQDFRIESDQFIGDMLALSSAIFVTLYLFVARMTRGEIDLMPYLTLVYGAAALILLIFNLAANHNLVDYSPRVHLLFLLLALVPTGVGHSLINWAARRIEVYKVNLAVLGEPLIASILAYFFFQELPLGWFYAGAALILGGIALALWEGKTKVGSKK